VKQTKQQRDSKRRALVACARALVEAQGPSAVRLLLLAETYGTCTLTARRWLEGAGVDLSCLKRGRPSVERLEAADAASAFVADFVAKQNKNLDAFESAAETVFKLRLCPQPAAE